jgi:type II secretory ATPase GspE/PulE/Tfp pilus assembly ATPase PilB-like protein
MDKLGEILIKMGAVDEEQLAAALEESKKTGEMFGKILMDKGHITERDLLEGLSKQLDVPFMPSLKDVDVPDSVLKAVPVKFVWHYRFMPLAIENKVLKMALSNPLEVWPTEDIKMLLGYDTEVVLVPQDEIVEAIKKFYGVGADTVQKILDKKAPDGSGEEPPADKSADESGKKAAGEASVIRLVDQIIFAAVKSRATDIHFENYKSKVRVRCRVDGILYDLALPPNINLLYSAMISRIKIMSNLDVVEKRLPQDGRAKIKHGDTEVDLRISIIPVGNGENGVIRILPTKMIFKLEELGFMEDDLKKLKTLIHMPNGVIFLVGPTGSGKTTTLYACLLEIKSSDTKIITIEDPVEYELDDITQMQVMPKIGLTFAQCLRSVLRHDPDVMMVGEVRDTETAELAVRSALTGHLMFSTLHTNNSTGGVTRLVDMGVEPFLLVSSVRAFIAQRLARMICDKCKIEVPGGGVFTKNNIKLDKYYRGKGCEECRYTGYKGRIAIYELFIVDDEMKGMIVRRAPELEIRKRAREKGMRTLMEVGWERVREGLTTPEEIMRITESDED